MNLIKYPFKFLVTRNYSSSTVIVPKDMIPVFMYGTLKKGEANHDIFTKTTKGKWKLLCQGETLEKFPLVIATKYNIPFLLHKKGHGDHVQGEVYAVNLHLFDKLDCFYEYPRTYSRLQYDVVNLTTERPNYIKCWIYFITRFKDSLLERPILSEYNKFGSHGLKYVPINERSSMSTYNYRKDILEE